MRHAPAMKLAAVSALSLALAACGGVGGPSANAEAEQSAATSSEAAQEWAREDLVVRSSASNIAIPAPGVIASALAEVGGLNQEAGEVPLQLLFAGSLRAGLPLADFEGAAARHYSPETAATTGQPISPQEFAKLVDDWAAQGEGAARKFEASAGPLAAQMLWAPLSRGDLSAFDAATRHFKAARVAARWCATPATNGRGWPVETSPRSERDQAVLLAYLRTVEQATASCANLVAKIGAGLGPIAYADQAALRVAIYKRLAAFSIAELQAMADNAPLEDVTLDMTGFQGHAWNSKRGRFENAGSGWVWQSAGLVNFSASHVYGREITIQLASTASGTQRRTVTSNQAISAEARQRASAGVQVGSPSGSGG